MMYLYFGCFLYLTDPIVCESRYGEAEIAASRSPAPSVNLDFVWDWGFGARIPEIIGFYLWVVA